MRTLTLLLITLAVFTSINPMRAEETVCAKVFIEIRQEVALARQAFEARMGITNSLPDNLTNVQVTLNFADEDGNPVAGVASTFVDPNAYFFYRADASAGGTASVPHPSTIPSGSSPKLVWTIIPTLTAANAGVTPSSSGNIYQIGAELRYTIAGKQEIVTVNPDFIRVKPLPEIQLDYFVPYDVPGDDPMTLIVEPPVPFSLALRARNVGVGIANEFTVESQPPKIIRNDIGAPVQFTLNSTRLNDGLMNPSLLVAAGNVSPGQSAMIRFEMRSRLAGRFTEFTAELSHSDELGGALTAVVRPPRTHRLQGEVLVDLPGRDGVVDFLAFDSMTSDTSPLRVFESQTVDPGVPANLEPVLVPPNNINLSASPSGSSIQLGTASPTTNAFSYVRGIDPWSGTRKLRRIVRSDGKILNTQNAWLSRHYGPPSLGAPPVTVFYVNVFDWLGSGGGVVSWALEYEAAPSNRAPVLGPLSNRIVKHGQPVTIAVTSSDPDGQIVAVALPIRPFGSSFTTDNNGSGSFTWTPGDQGIPQLGDFPLSFSASDGIASASRTVVLTVTDGELLDAWKSRWWTAGDPNSANSADPDGDGLQNLYEYALDLDPTRSSTHQRPVLTQMEQGGKHYLALTATYRTDDAKLVIDVVGSPDKDVPDNAWTEVGTGSTVDASTTPSGFHRARFLDSVALEDSPTQARFLRLRVRLLP
jgi:hypothetical protein